jgi:hypothetical protein
MLRHRLTCKLRLLLVLVVAALLVAATGCAIPGLALSPTSGGVGTKETASASGFEPGETIDVYFNGVVVASCVASASGSCASVFTIPSEPTGDYPVTARGVKSGLKASKTFHQNVATLSLSPGIGLAGTEVVATASGFAAGETVVVAFNGLAPGSTCVLDANERAARMGWPWAARAWPTPTERATRPSRCRPASRRATTR